MSLFRHEQRQWAPEPIVSPFPGVSMFGKSAVSTSADSAMQQDAVWACVTLLANSVSMLPLGAYTLHAGSRFPIPDPPFLRYPSSDATISEWIYMVMVSLLLRGNAYGTILARDSYGRPTQIELLAPDSVHPRTDPDTGALVYTVNGKKVDTGTMFHVRAFRMPGSRLGLSPIQYAAAKISTDAAAGAFGLGFFQDGAHPSSILSSDADFNQDQAKMVKDRFMAAVKGREPAVLSGGLKYTAIQVSPSDSQFLETQKFSDVAIARIFSVPPVMVGMSSGDSMSYSNDNQRTVDFLTFSVQHWLTKIEDALAPILPGQQHFRFDPAVLLRTDLETLIKTTAIGIASKQLTPDEARAMQDYPPLTPEQKKILELVPLTVSPTGRPQTIKVAPSPAADPATEGEPA